MPAPRSGVSCAFSERLAVFQRMKFIAPIFAWLVPLFLLNVVAFSFFWPIAHALVHGLYGFALGLLGLQVMLFKFRHFPFSRKLEKGRQTMQLSMLFMMFGMFAAMFVLPYLFVSGPVWFISILGILLFLSVVLGRLNNRVYARQALFQED